MTNERFQSTSPVWFALGSVLALPAFLFLMFSPWVLLPVVGIAGITLAPAGILVRWARHQVGVRPAVEVPTRLVKTPAFVAQPQPLFQPVHGDVAVRVSQTHGTCPMGYTYREGAEYLFQNGSVTPELCPVAQQAIQPLVEQLRQGEYPTTVKPFCSSTNHEVVFELEAFRRKRKPRGSGAAAGITV